jgi:TetR/AcrR family transcriptional regulator
MSSSLVATPETAPTAKRERRKEARPAELLAAALDLFVEKGYAATRAEQVAQRAGVSKGTLFLYFPSKEELFKAVVRENITGRISEALEEVKAWDKSADELIHFIMQQWWSRYGDTKASGISKLMMSEASNFPELAAFYQQNVIAPGRNLIRQAIQFGQQRHEFREVDLDYAVFAVLAPIMFLITWKHSLGGCCMPNEAIDPERYLRSQADIVVQGLLNRAAHPTAVG